MVRHDARLRQTSSRVNGMRRMLTPRMQSNRVSPSNNLSTRRRGSKRGRLPLRRRRSRRCYTSNRRIRLSRINHSNIRRIVNTRTLANRVVVIQMVLLRHNTRPLRRHGNHVTLNINVRHGRRTNMTTKSRRPRHIPKRRLQQGKHTYIIRVKGSTNRLQSNIRYVQGLLLHNNITLQRRCGMNITTTGNLLSNNNIHARANILTGRINNAMMVLIQIKNRVTKRRRGSRRRHRKRRSTNRGTTGLIGTKRR